MLLLVGVEKVRGTEEGSYFLLPTYLYLLKEANPGTVYHIHSIPEEDGYTRFKYMFVALGASIKGLKYMRKVMVVDGTQLTGRYRGVLLIACVQDGNFQIYPVAFGIVDGETDASWEWFFNKLSTIIADADDLMVISDRHSSIYKGLSKVYPLATHGACLVHLERNVSARFTKSGLSDLIFSAGKAYRVKHFKEHFAEIKKRSPSCAKYLEDIGFEHWTRAYCKGARYNMMSTNIGESMNAVLAIAKGLPIVSMVESIRGVLMRWFAARRKVAEASTSIVTPEVDKRFLYELPDSTMYSVAMSSGWTFQVSTKTGGHYTVNLERGRCTCLQFDRLRLPCEHALAASRKCGLNVKTTAAEPYKLNVCLSSVQEPIFHAQDVEDVDLPDEVKQIKQRPPLTRRPSGRPRTIRIRSKGEKWARRFLRCRRLFDCILRIIK